jgi:hypothetical protein
MDSDPVLDPCLFNPLLPKFGENLCRLSWLDQVAIGLGKLYAKSELGTNLVMYDAAMMFLMTGSKYLKYISSIRICTMVTIIGQNK